MSTANFLQIDSFLFSPLPQKTMIPDYYQLFGLKRFEAFRLTDEQIFQRLSETVEMGYSIDVIVSRFETGIYILSNDYFK